MATAERVLYLERDGSKFTVEDSDGLPWHYRKGLPTLAGVPLHARWSRDGFLHLIKERFQQDSPGLPVNVFVQWELMGYRTQSIFEYQQV
jgi:hypothetical protein